MIPSTELRTGARPRALVLRAPGSNCDRETAIAFERAGANVAAVHVNRLLEDRAALDEADVLAVPGGFSYGDDLGAGRILGTKLALRLADAVRALVDRGGLVIGICNGFQALVRAGLLPATGEPPLERGPLRGVNSPSAHSPPPPAGRTELAVPEATLAPNASGRFEARWTRLVVLTSRSPWLAKGTVFDFPVAHGEGRFVPRDERVEKALAANDQIALRYARPASGVPGVDGDGVLDGPAGYPFCPSGSALDIAGVVDTTGRILGLMPHPERDQDPWLRPGFARGAPGVRSTGLDIFRAAVEHLLARKGQGAAT